MLRRTRGDRRSNTVRILRGSNKEMPIKIKIIPPPSPSQYMPSLWALYLFQNKVQNSENAVKTAPIQLIPLRIERTIRVSSVRSMVMPSFVAINSLAPVTPPVRAPEGSVSARVAQGANIQGGETTA